MPYKDADKRREKQRDHKRKIRFESREDASYMVSLPKTNIEIKSQIKESIVECNKQNIKREDASYMVSLPSIKKRELFQYTIRGVDGIMRNIEQTPDMIECYKY